MTRRARAPERRVRTALRLRVRRLRRRAHPSRAAAGAARAAGEHARRGARDRAAGALRHCTVKMGTAPVDADYLRDLADLVLRMLHVVAGIAWIGASFYFIRLDLGLAPPKEPKEGVAGEYWGVHGGGFYHSQKYKVAPPQLPEHLHWFKWEAYTTWLSGFSLLACPLLARRRYAPHRPDRRRPRRLAGGGALGGRARARLACLRPRLPRPDRGPAGRRRGDRARRRLGLRSRRALRRTGVVPPGRRDARDDHGRERLLRDHPGAPGADSGEAREAGARPPRGASREAALGAQQLPDAAGRLHDARGPLPARLRRRPRVARPTRDLRGGGGDPALLQPLAHGQARLVDLGRGRCGGCGPGDRPGARGAGRFSCPERQPPRRSRSPRSAAQAATPASAHRSASGS